jgi:hypothetical protein
VRFGVLRTRLPGASAAVPLGLLRTWAEENLDDIAALNPNWAG